MLAAWPECNGSLFPLLLLFYPFLIPAIKMMACQIQLLLLFLLLLLFFYFFASSSASKRHWQLNDLDFCKQEVPVDWVLKYYRATIRISAEVSVKISAKYAHQALQCLST